MTDRQREYERLIAPIEDRMIRTVWRISRDSSDAEDAFQEALLTVWKRWDRVVSHPNPHALILHMCVNAAHDVLRRSVRQGKWIEEDAVSENTVDSSTSPFESVAGEEQRLRVLRAIGVLPKNQARAILMHAVEEVPYADIAAAMKCGESTVRKHVARARTRLRTLLSHLMGAIHKEETSHA